MALTWARHGEGFVRADGARVVKVGEGQKPWLAYDAQGNELCGRWAGRALRFASGRAAVLAVRRLDNEIAGAASRARGLYATRGAGYRLSAVFDSECGPVIAHAVYVAIAEARGMVGPGHLDAARNSVDIWARDTRPEAVLAVLDRAVAALRRIADERGGIPC